VSALHRSIFRDRLQPPAESQEQEGGEACQPSLSLFGLIQEGHLSRSAAAMLFYQVCGELKQCTSGSTRDEAVPAIHWVCDRQCSRCCSCDFHTCGSSISRASQTVCCCCTQVNVMLASLLLLGCCCCCSDELCWLHQRASGQAFWRHHHPAWQGGAVSVLHYRSLAYYSNTASMPVTVTAGGGAVSCCVLLALVTVPD
jgi:hypothetical protein